MSAPTATRATLAEIERRLEQVAHRRPDPGPGRPADGGIPIDWLEEQLTWLYVLRDCLSAEKQPGDRPDATGERQRCDRLIAVLERRVAGRRDRSACPVSWETPGPGAQLM